MPSKSGTVSAGLAAFVIAGVVSVTLAGAVALAGRGNHDLRIYIDAGQRVLNHGPVYGVSDGGPNWFVGNQDLVGPPFQGLFFVPLAWLAGHTNSGVASAVWDLVNLATLLGGFWLWSRALDPSLPAAFPVWRSQAAMVTMLAIAVPVFANFRDQNTTAIVFCLVGAAAIASVRHQEISAGFWIGVATALKAYPGLLIAHLLFRRRWIAAMSAIVTGGLLTGTVVVFVGPTGLIDAIHAWLAHSAPALWPQWTQNQSIALAARRLAAPPADTVITTAATGVLLLINMVATWRAPRTAAGAELALVLAIAVLLSPISWNHYWILMFGAATFAWAAPGRLRTARRWGVIIAGVLLTVLSRLTLGDAGAEVLRIWAHCTIAGLVLTFAAASALLERARTPAV